MEENQDNNLTSMAKNIIGSLKKLFSDYVDLVKKETQNEMKAGISLFAVILVFLLTMYTGLIVLLFLFSIFLLQIIPPLALFISAVILYITLLAILVIIAKTLISKIKTGITEPKELFEEFVKCLKQKK
ncbi:MAG: phage holin family protein [Candidatus Gastranaerophilales bacterium]|nr:phage holin family protein [Candidatus Gastranaerophilales bacterium]